MSEDKQPTENLGSSIGPQRGPSSPARVESQSKAIRRELAAMDEDDMLKSNLQLGTLLITRLAETFLEQKGVSVLELVDKHASGDWGDICEEDKGVNEDALHYGNRVMSVYNITNTESIWIITEADRRSTTILLPEEY